MGHRRDDWGQEDNEVYTSSQTEGVLEYCGISIVADTNTHFLCYCPWHGNTDSPALAVDKVRGVFHCFNPSCTESGTILDMLRRLKRLNYFQAHRVILKKRHENTTPFSERLREAMETEVDFVEFPQEVLDKMKAAFPGSVAEEYMMSRGFTKETLDYFDVGYSVKTNMVTVPMHDGKGMPIGTIGRSPSHTDKVFKNSTGLPKAKTAWNFHRAKRHGATVVICEASYDAMRIHQAGYPNVIAFLGGSVTQWHLDQLSRTFSTIIIMSDNDAKQYRPNCRKCKNIKFKFNEVPCVGHSPGRELGRQIVDGLPNKKVMWAAYDSTCIFPHGAKDASDMTDDEIKQCLKNAVSNLEYTLWNPESIAS